MYPFSEQATNNGLYLKVFTSIYLGFRYHYILKVSLQKKNVYPFFYLRLLSKSRTVYYQKREYRQKHSVVINKALRDMLMSLMICMICMSLKVI